jgi:hypothetical protein
MLVANSGVALAAYGPPLPPTTTVPGGYYCIMTSQTVGPAGRFIGSLDRGGLKATIRVPRGTFPVRVQITVSEPYGHGGGCQGGPGIGNGGFPGFLAVGGLGILVQRHGSIYHRKFHRPLVLSMSWPSGGKSNLILVWNGHSFVKAAATTGHASATVHVARSADFAVLSGTGHQHRSRAVATLRAAGPAEDLFVAALLRSAGAPQPGLGVLRSRRLAATDASRSTLLP